MATHIFGRQHVLPRRRSLEAAKEAEQSEPRGGAFRGLLFAMLFNGLLALAGVAIWQLWELLR